MAERSACGKCFWVCFLVILSVSHQVTLACARSTSQDSSASTERNPELCFFNVEEFRESNHHLAFYEKRFTRYEIAIPGIDARGKTSCGLKLMYEDKREERLPFDEECNQLDQCKWYLHKQSDEYYYLYFNGTEPQSGRYQVIGHNNDTKGGFYVIKNDRGNTSNLKSFTDRKIKITNTDFVACVRYNLLDNKSDLVKCQSEKQKIPFLGAIDRNATNSKSTVLKFPRRGHTSEQNYTCNCTVPGIWSDDDAATVTVWFKYRENNQNKMGNQEILIENVHKQTTRQN